MLNSFQREGRSMARMKGCNPSTQWAEDAKWEVVKDEAREESEGQRWWSLAFEKRLFCLHYLEWIGTD